MRAARDARRPGALILFTILFILSKLLPSLLPLPPPSK